MIRDSIRFDGDRRKKESENYPILSCSERSWVGTCPSLFFNKMLFYCVPVGIEEIELTTYR